MSDFYCDKDDVLLFFNSRDVIRTTNEHSDTENINNDVINELIASSSSHIKSQLRNIRDTNNPKLKELCVRFVFYGLMRRNRALTEEIERDYERALSELKDISRGSLQFETVDNYKTAELIQDATSLTDFVIS